MRAGRLSAEISRNTLLRTKAEGHDLAGLLATPRRRLARNLTTLVAGDLMGRLLAAAAFIHLVRTLQPAFFGDLELALAVVMVLTLVVDLGLKTLGAREVVHRPESAGALVRRRRVLSAGHQRETPRAIRAGDGARAWGAR
jgi:hypothetical protein